MMHALEHKTMCQMLGVVTQHVPYNNISVTVHIILRSYKYHVPVLVNTGLVALF